ncbi:MAG: ATPase domain-containing protein [Anaerolineae bacterium]
MQNVKRVATGIPGLDAMLNGGFLPRTANLVEGAPGTGKSTLGMQYIYEGARRDEPGIILTFEEFPEQYYRDAEAFGWDFRALERQNKLKIIMSSPEVTKADLENVEGTIQNLIAEMGAQRMLIDSITHFEGLHQDPVKLRKLMYGYLNALKRQDLTLILTRESTHLFGEGLEGQLDASIQFLADTYIMLRYVEIESTVQRAIVVLKMRGSAHDSTIRQFEINAQGLKVLQAFEGQEGVLSGSPKRMSESFMKAFVRR